jgi:hypothetical protein
VVTPLWISYGAVIALRMAMFPQPTKEECLVWLAAAAMLGIFAYFKESSTRKVSDLEIRGLNEKLSKMQGFMEGSTSAMGNTISRIGTLPETSLKGEEIVKELKAELKELRENVKALDETTFRRPVPVPLSRARTILIKALMGLLALLLMMFLWFGLKSTYDQFPDPMSPAQISDLTDRLRKERPQRLKIIRQADRKSVALAEQFRKIFESAHWLLVTPPQPPNNGLTLLRGLVVWRAPDDLQALAFSRVLHNCGLPYETLTDIELTGSGYFELTISDGWLTPPPHQ